MLPRSVLRLAGLLGLLGPLAVAAGCSLINSYDEVKDQVPSDDGGGPGTDATTETGGPGAEGGNEGGSDVVVPPDNFVPDAGPTGAVVVSALGKLADGGNEYVLAVLDPSDGHELSREYIASKGTIYDDVADIWYVFEAPPPDGTRSANGPDPDPFEGDAGDPLFVRARKLDSAGKWTELGRIRIPVIASGGAGTFQAFASPLKERLAYIAYGATIGTASSQRLVVINTSSPSALAADSGVDAGSLISIFDLGTMPAGLVGSRLTSPTGGNVTIVDKACAAGSCQFSLRPIKVALGAPFDPKPSELLGGPVPGAHAVSFGSYTPPTELYAVPSSAFDAGQAQLQRWSAANNDPSLAAVSFTPSNNQFQPIVVSNCLQIAFVTERTGNKVFAVPMGAGTTTEIAASGVMAFEPFTKGLYFINNNALTAVTISGAPGGAINSAARTLNVPTDLKIFQMTTRNSPAFAPCN